MIVTRRLCLRSAAAHDFAGFAHLITDPEVRAYLGGPVPSVHVEAAFAPYRREAAPGAWYLAVSRRLGGPLLGVVSVSPHKDGADMELSYAFVPAVWGQGVAFEACTALLRAAAVPRVIAETQRANQRSRVLLERLGFAAFGTVHRFGAEQVLLARRHEESRPHG